MSHANPYTYISCICFIFIIAREVRTIIFSVTHKNINPQTLILHKMSSPMYVVNAHYNGETYVTEELGFLFRDTHHVSFSIKRNASLLHLKRRIEKYLGSLLVSRITYKNPV